MAGIQFNVSDREMHSLDKDLPRMSFPLDGMFCHIPGCPFYAHHVGMNRDYMKHWKRERVTYCDPGRVLPPKCPDTNVASVSDEVQVITIEESISPREAAHREMQRVALSVRHILTEC